MFITSKKKVILTGITLVCFFLLGGGLCDYLFLDQMINKFVFRGDSTLLYSYYGLNIIELYQVTGVDFLTQMGKQHPELNLECQVLASVFEDRCQEVLALLKSNTNYMNGIPFGDHPGHVEMHRIINLIQDLSCGDISLLEQKGYDISRMSALLCHLDGCFSRVFRLSPEHIVATITRDQHIFVLKGWCNMHYYPFVRDEILPFAGDISLAQMKLLTATPVIIDLPSMAPLV